MQSTIGSKHLFIVIFILTVLSIFYYKDVVTGFPSHIHAWAQSDRYALALGFLKNGFDFFQPQTYNLNPQFPSTQILAEPKGITSVDFPIHEYIIALLMKCFHTNSPGVFRIYILLYSCFGLYFLWKLARLITGSSVAGYFMLLFVFTMPVYTYYQAGFIPSVPSFANCLMGLYFYFRYLKERQFKSIILSISFLTLAALCRTPFVIILCSIFLVQIIDSKKNKFPGRKEMIVFAISFLSIGMYYFYNSWLRDKYGSVFLNSLRPVEGFGHLKLVLEGMKEKWLFHYLSLAHYIIYFSALIITLIVSFKGHSSSTQDFPVRLFRWFLFVSGCGILVYFLVMANQFVDHDYYFIDSFLIFFTMSLLFFIGRIKDILIRYAHLSLTLFIAFSIYAIFLSSGVQALRRQTFDWDRTEITRMNFTGSDRFLDSLNVSGTAKILVIDAYSPNAPFILMDRQGYAVMTTSKERIIESLTWNFDYVVIQDCFLLSEVIRNYPDIIHLLNKVGGNNKISLYKKSGWNNNVSLSEFLGLDKATPLYKQELTFDSMIDKENWSNADQIDNQIYFSPPFSGILKSSDEFGPTLTIGASQVPNGKMNQVYAEARCFNKSEYHDLFISITMEANGKQYYFSSNNVANDISHQNGWKLVQIQFFPPAFLTPNDKMKIYFHNAGHNSLHIDDFKIILF